MKKIDFKKELKQFYGPTAKQVVEVVVPAMKFLMVDGKGAPDTSAEFGAATEALFGVSYAIKFMVKKGDLVIDYGVLPLEGLWWADDMSSFSSGDKSEWQWTLMIMQPEFVTSEMVDAAIAQVTQKKNPPAITKLRFQEFSEGRCAQTLHVGPFSEEGPTIARVHEFIAERGERSGKHHEIYLSDIRKAAPEKWKTVIRQPLV
jgi:hypothetical protein